MKNLIINGINYGVCERYLQDRERKSWFFIMKDFSISVEFEKIKSFTSHGDLEILTY